MRTRLLIRLPRPLKDNPQKLAGEEGFEPSLPLTKRRIGQEILFFLSNPLTSTLGQVPFWIPVKGLFAGKATEVVFLLPSSAPLPEPPLRHYLEPLWYHNPVTIIPLSCLKKYAQTPRTAWPPASLYVMTDNASETLLLLATLTMAPLTLPEYDVEVLL